MPGNAVSSDDDFVPMKRGDFARSIFGKRLTGMQARYAVCAVIDQYPDLKAALAAAGYQRYDRKKYSARQRRILSDFFTHHLDVIEDFTDKYKNFSK